MPENDFELRSVAWSKVFPFLRLFRTFKLAIDARNLTLALACVLVCYVAGRVLDRAWRAGGAGVVRASASGGPRTEIEAYGAPQVLHSEPFAQWRRDVEQNYRQQVIGAVQRWTPAQTADEARRLLAGNSVWSLVDTPEHRQHVAQVRQGLNAQLARRLEAIDAEAGLSAEQKAERKRKLRRQADYLRLILAGKPAEGLLSGPQRAAALEALVDTGLEPERRAAQQALWREVIDRQRSLIELRQRAPQGPFISLLDYEMRCFGAAVQGVCAGRWGFSGGALDPAPGMLGSIASAGRGLLWLVTQKPVYALVYGVVLLLSFSFFGGAICRCVALRVAREESIELRAALGFAGQKFGGLLMAPVVPVGIFVVGAVLMFLGGLVGAIPYVGELLVGVLYGLALLGGFALALIVLGTVLGLNLMAPTIAAEGSDAFDAVQHAFGYVGQRPLYAGFYAFVLLLYGAACFVVARLIALLLLLLTHAVSGAGMSLFGALSSSSTASVGKLEAIWRMPAWGELSLLPSAGGVPFWGSFLNAPLNWSESVAAVLIACWVFLCVGLLGAFIVSFYFAGSTQMYFLLRYQVDAVDFEEVYYEEQKEPEAEEEPAAGEPAAATAQAETQPPAAAESQAAPETQQPPPAEQPPEGDQAPPPEPPAATG